jgi:DNA invertase Pin-like site-specific DNA recombinase
VEKPGAGVLKSNTTGKMIGYARVSTEDQELRLQLDALKEAGCWNVWKEKRSASKGRMRPELEKALADLRPGDTLVVWKLDRLVRNAREMYALLDRIHAAGANFKSLQEGYDFTTPMGQFVLGLLGLLAQLEADMTSHRTSAGIKAIQERGIPYGATPKLSDAKAKELVKLRQVMVPVLVRGKLAMRRKWTIAKLAERFKISTASVANYMGRVAQSKRRRKPKNKDKHPADPKWRHRR